MINYPTNMRVKGKLKSWNDDRGFGFIVPIDGDQEIFVHIKAFPRRSCRPQVDQLLWFEVEVGPEGKKRAKNVEFVRRTIASNNVPHPSPAPKGTATLLAIPIFAVLYIVIAFLWQPPFLLALIYPMVSAITFLVYARDKSAAQRGDQRTPEFTLHLLDFVGGWPGGLLAQQLLRHKSRKFEFRAVFWVTVILNVAAFILFCSPLIQSFLRSSLDTNPTATRRR